MLPQTEELMNRIKNTEINETSYLLLHGSDNKIWLIPRNNVKRGLIIFQPGSGKGRIAKKILPLVYRLPFVLKHLHIESYKYDLNVDIHNMVRNVTGADNLTYSIYIGDTTFLQNQKMVVQIMGGDGLLGYAKFAVNDSIKKTFFYEADVLNYLTELEIKHVPRVLWVGNEQGISGFIQTTEKVGNEPTVLYIDDRHKAFLKIIHDKSQRKVEFKGSPFETMLLSFVRELQASDWKSASKIITIIEHLKGKLNEQGYIGTLFHGDFTPWNVCAQEDHIFVFDFEYAQYNYPEWMDVFHFRTQVALYNDDAGVDEIYMKFEKEKKLLNEWITDPELSYICYLTHILYFYYKRWNGRLSEEERSCKTWIQMLEKLDQNYFNER